MSEVWSRFRKLQSWSERIAAERCDCGKRGLWIALNIAGVSGLRQPKFRVRMFMCDECHSRREK